VKKLWGAISVCNQWHDSMVRKFDMLWVLFSSVLLIGLFFVPLVYGYKSLGIAGGVVAGCLLIARMAYKSKLELKKKQE
jgi:hypothetical protein